MTNHAIRIRIATAFLATLILGGFAAGYAQSLDPANQAMTGFERAMHDYVSMHRRLEREIGSVTADTPIEALNRLIAELAGAIRAERPDARQGDFFTPVVARELRSRISLSLFDHDFTASDVRAAALVEGIDYARVRLRVNATFPWALSVAMFPCILEALPALPPELQYRMVGDNLLLIDVHASLVVDILPGALADYTIVEHQGE